MKRAVTKKTLYRGVSACALIAVCAGTAMTARAAEIEAAGPSNTVQEIIVTAERRNESAQDVPMTVQAFSGETLQENNIETLEDLLKMTPNVTFANNGPGQGNVYMRGLGAGFAGNQSSATIGNFPNTAIYLDDQSMQFPSRNVDIYMVDMERVEVLEGPQGTLFGGGAEAGALRYITNKPKLNTFEARAEGAYSFTSGGDPNNSENAMINLPLIKDVLAMRVVLYDDRQGGYINNVPSTFTRSNQDLGNYYLGVSPSGNGLCPNGKGPGPTGCTLATGAGQQINNSSVAGNAQNPLTNSGGRVSVLGQINDDWNFLVTETLSNLDAEGMSVEMPLGSDFQQLKPLEETSFSPTYDHDRYTNTAWTLSGDIDGWKAVYTGGYTSRHIDQQMDYTNYSRTGGGMYYQCTGGTGGLFGAGKPVQCYSPQGYWHDTVDNTHLTEEARVSTPDTWRIRAIGGGYWEQFRIQDVMNFDYKTIPDCTPSNLAAADAGGATCLADVRTAPGSTANDPGVRGANTAFGEDTQRGYDQTAFFGSVDFDIIPDVLTVTGGTRFYRYTEFELGSQYGTNGSCVDVPNGQCASGMVNIDSAGDHKTYAGTRSRGNLTWKVAPDMLAYFTFSQGFRPGGFNRSISAVAPLGAGKTEPQYEKPNSYAPDSLTNYEVGWKSQLFEHRLQLNVSAYYMDWKNVQMNFYNPVALGNTSFGVNGPDYNVKGLETQVIAKPIDGVTLSGSGSYNDATQTTSPCLASNVAGSPTQGQCITQIYQAGTGVVSFQNPFGALGTPPAFSPKFQGNLQARYDWRMLDYKAFATVGTTYMGSMYNQLATYPSGTGVLIPSTTLLRYLQPSYETFDAAVTVMKDNWTMGLFGTNLGDSHASQFTSSTQFIKTEVPIRPRVVGLKLSATF